MKLKLALGALVCALSLPALTLLGPAASARTTSGLTARCSTPTCVTQTITGAAHGHAYDLTSKVTRFQRKHGSLVADITTTGTRHGTPISPIHSIVPVTLLKTLKRSHARGASLAANDPCSILDLTLKPLHLNLLGLVVDLNEVHLTISGETGPGNLLGNLVCGVTNALNGGHGGEVATLLNRLLEGL